MDRCRACGARLSDDVRWCVQCYRPISQVKTSLLLAPRSTRTRTDPVLVLPEARTTHRGGRITIPEARPPRSLPRLLAALVATLLLAALGVVLGWAFVEQYDGSGATWLQTAALGVYSVAAIGILWVAWHPSR